MKILSAETNLASATNVSNAPVVRLFNSGASNILVTQKDYLGTNEGTFMVMSGDVVYCEKYYTDTLEGGADIKATKVAYSSMMRFVGASVAVPTYTYSVSATNVDEGGSFTTTVTTTNVDDNTTLYWSLSGTGITSGDFSSGALTGSGTISNNTFNFSHTLANDQSQEGSETVTLKLFTDAGRNTQVGNEVTVQIADTSTMVIGQSQYTTVGTFSWTAPAGVTSVSVITIGGGGGGATYGGGGGELRYKNNIAVTPGNSYEVIVGDGGAQGNGGSLTNRSGTFSKFNSTTVIANGGEGGQTNNNGGSGGTGDGGGNGGKGVAYGGGGGTGGYSGDGGDGGDNGGGNGSSGSGGAGGGGAGGGGNSCGGGGGGGTGSQGSGSNGSGGSSLAAGGSGGSSGNSGQNGICGVSNQRGGYGGDFGGGGGGGLGGDTGGRGGYGCVRIIWPGSVRQFPSTRTADE